jgi:hypothetical protein
MATVFHIAGEYRTPQGRLRLPSAAEKAQHAQTPALGRGTAFDALETEAAAASQSGIRPGPAFATRLRHEAGPPGSANATADGADALGFDDLLDLVNPLHHIPVVSTLYRALTGDEIRAPVEIAGGALFGGPFGFVTALANAVVDEAAGRDVGEIALAALTGEPETDTVQLAAQTAATPGGVSAAAEPIAPAAGPSEEGGSSNAAAWTGAHALAALAADLRGLAHGGAADAVAPAAALAAAPAAAPVAPVAIEASTGALPPALGPGAATLSAGGFAARMMQALDRYEDMAKNPDAARAGAVRVDGEL